VKQLKLKDARVLKAPTTANCPISKQVDFARRRLHLERHDLGRAGAQWRLDPADREGLTICDATSAAFAQDLPFDKLDVVTFSWQKALGGEAAHGMLILSPRAVARLESYSPPWPMPKIFRMTKGGKLNEGIFHGETINTPSMLCVEDYLDALRWANCRRFRRPKRLARTSRQAAGDAVQHLRLPVHHRSGITALDRDAQAAFAKTLVSLLDKEGVAFDIGAYRDAPPGLRIWTGGTVETTDLEALMPWLDWAFHSACGALDRAA
jgi:phosphoserine aminotransferase